MRTAPPAPPRVLVVENDYFIASEIERDLRSGGLEVVGPVSSVAGALRLISGGTEEGGIAAAVLDIALADGDVTPVADALAARRVPFVFATGYGPEYGSCGYINAPVLLKPFSAQAVISAVSDLIGQDPSPKCESVVRFRTVVPQ